MGRAKRVHKKHFSRRGIVQLLNKSRWRNPKNPVTRGLPQEKFNFEGSGALRSTRKISSLLPEKDVGLIFKKWFMLTGLQ